MYPIGRPLEEEEEEEEDIWSSLEYIFLFLFQTSMFNQCFFKTLRWLEL
jgi:hypothetical protein